MTDVYAASLQTRADRAVADMGAQCCTTQTVRLKMGVGISLGKIRGEGRVRGHKSLCSAQMRIFWLHFYHRHYMGLVSVGLT